MCEPVKAQMDQARLLGESQAPEEGPFTELISGYRSTEKAGETRPQPGIDRPASPINALNDSSLALARNQTLPNTPFDPLWRRDGCIRECICVFEPPVCESRVAIVSRSQRTVDVGASSISLRNCRRRRAFARRRRNLLIMAGSPCSAVLLAAVFQTTPRA